MSTKKAKKGTNSLFTRGKVFTLALLMLIESAASAIAQPIINKFTHKGNGNYILEMNCDNISPDGKSGNVMIWNPGHDDHRSTIAYYNGIEDGGNKLFIFKYYGDPNKLVFVTSKLNRRYD